MDTQEHLFGLMAIAEEHQAAVRAAIEALASERQLLGQQSAAHSKQLRELTAAAASASQDLHRAAGAAMRTVVMRSVEHATHAVVTAFDGAMQPLLEQLSNSADAAGDAHARLRTTMAWFTWRWLAVLAAGAGGVVAMIWLISMAMIEWQRYQIDTLRDERQTLTAEIAKLNATVSDFESRGGRAELATCGNPGHLCIRVNKKTGYGEERDFFVVKGY